MGGPAMLASLSPAPGLAVLAACWAVQQLPVLPAPMVAATLLCLGLLLTLACLQAPAWTAFAAAGVLALGWALLLAGERLDERWPAALEGVDLRVRGLVEEMPQADERGLRFRFRIEHCTQADGADCPAARSVRLGWHSGPFAWGGVAPRAPAAATPPPMVRPGERWEFAVRLERPHSSLNPLLFDPELRATEEGIAATGYVRAGRSGADAARRVQPFVPRPGVLIERARHEIRARMLAGLGSAPPVPRGVVVALAVGDQAAIPAAWWELFNRTGVGHLMSISGLHITMLAALGAWLAGRVWSSRRLALRMHPRPLPSRLPAPHARWACGLVVAFGYAGLAGWGIPAQRTCWMLAAAGVALLSGRARSPVAVLATAAAVVCALDPWAPLAAGFWLSFAAVGSIIWAGSARGARTRPRAEGAAQATPQAPAVRRHPVRPERVRPGEAQAAPPAPIVPVLPDPPEHGRAAVSGWLRHRGRRWRTALTELLREALRSQFAATLVLVPLGVVFFSSVSLVSPVANAFAIPLVSAVITPLALAGAALALVWTPAGALPLWLAAWLTEWLLAALQWLDRLGGASLPMPWPGVLAVLVGAAACAFALSPARFPGRWLAALGLCPLLFAPPKPPGPAEIRLTALDVGQGTAVLVETAQGRLLYDTGPALGPDSEAGARVILPWLRAHGIDRLQAVVVSHEDLDHSGGALSVLRGTRVDWVASSLAPEHPIVAAAPRHYRCIRGERWKWGEVSFEWLHPGTETVRIRGSQTNARSCVLRVHSAAGTVLLAGDIEAAQERQLLALFEADGLRADVLLAPHHGSRTSSTPGFLDAVAPSLAVFQVGYRNRYRHPNPQVLERYRARKVGVLRSDAHAAIEIHLRPGMPPQVVRHRVDRPRWWRVPVEESATAPSSPRRSSRPRHAPAARRPSTGTRRGRRSARA